jgi:cold shock CspA family protein
VTAFDDAAGLGTARLEDGRELVFHCTELADGTRTVTAGTSVSLLVAPGHRGTLEATGLLRL